MSNIIDISMPLSDGMVAWPGSPNVTTARVQRLEAGDGANGSTLAMDVHCGTHLDAPLHVLADGAPMASIGLERLVGPARVVEIPGVREISAEHLQRSVPAGTDRVLLKTHNSTGAEAGAAVFDEDFAALTPDGARWIVEHGVGLVGIDYLSIQRFADDQTTHETLLGNGVVILEGLLLAHVAPGPYELVCLPVSLPSLEAAPARAVLRPMESD